MKCTCGNPLTPRVMHRIDMPCTVVIAEHSGVAITATARAA